MVKKTRTVSLLQQRITKKKRNMLNGQSRYFNNTKVDIATEISFARSMIATKGQLPGFRITTKGVLPYPDCTKMIYSSRVRFATKNIFHQNQKCSRGVAFGVQDCNLRNPARFRIATKG